MNIPKKLHHIWIGELPAPTEWLNSWKEKHPTWQYRLWTNKDLYGRQWKNQKAIDHYISKKQWAGVADCMRYEILFEEGGVMMGADYICLNPIDELFEDGNTAYVIDTSSREGLKDMDKNKLSSSPLLACEKHSLVAKKLIQMIGRKKIFGSPVKTVGNRLMQKFFLRYNYNVKRFPIHYFIPEHFDGWKYTGKDKVYAKHFWGTTKNNYIEKLDVKYLS